MISRSGPGGIPTSVLLLAAALASCSDSPTAGDPPGGIGTTLEWPLRGAEGRDWVINNYVDLDPGPGLLDYAGGTKVYDGHRGVDIDVPNFRWMDAGFEVLAAAAGRVTGMEDEHFDRNVSCIGEWNYVEITHADGTRATYGHLKRGSIAVTVGDSVAARQTLGVVGSSGCSTQPHLHFEMRDDVGSVIDPFLEGMWVALPAYDPPLTLMDFNLQRGRIEGFAELEEPPSNISSIGLGETLGVGVSLAGGDLGDVVRVVAERGNGQVRR